MRTSTLADRCILAIKAKHLRTNPNRKIEEIAINNNEVTVSLESVLNEKIVRAPSVLATSPQHRETFPAIFSSLPETFAVQLYTVPGKHLIYWIKLCADYTVNKVWPWSGTVSSQITEVVRLEPKDL